MDPGTRQGPVDFGAWQPARARTGLAGTPNLTAAAVDSCIAASCAPRPPAEDEPGQRGMCE